MSLMSKLLISTLAISTIVSANVQPSAEDLLIYVKKNVVKNPQVTVKKINIIESKTHKDLPGWNILLTNMDIEYQKKEIHAPETMFVKDGLITGSLINLKTGENYKETIKPSVLFSMYDDAHLLFGNKDAKHKVLIFSDPQCPFCQDVVPKIFTASKENPSKLAVYYYHLPLLRIHPVSDVLTRVMHVAQEEGNLDVVEKIYSLKIKAQETNTTTILAAVKKHTGYSVSEEKIDAEETKKALKADEVTSSRMMVSGTPTIYIDGEWDKSRIKYLELLK